MPKESKKKKTVLEGMAIESILDLNSNNVWKLSAQEIRHAWESEVDTEVFLLAEDKLLNTIRIAFELVHYNPADEREREKYENGEWEYFQHCNQKKGWVAICKKHISRLSDLNYENIHTITAAGLLELIDRNFGGGWDSIALSMKDIILTCFDVTTATLPERRMHMEGGTLDKKVAQGFEVLEIQKGTWIEAIFAKKKDPVVKVKMNDDKYDEDGNLRKGHLHSLDEDYDEDDEDVDLPDDDMNDEEDEDTADDDQMDETFYSSYTEEAKQDPDDEDLQGLSLDDDI